MNHLSLLLNLWQSTIHDYQIGIRVGIQMNVFDVVRQIKQLFYYFLFTMGSDGMSRHARHALRKLVFKFQPL